MGLFDSVWVPCPRCGKPVEFQSKALDPCMETFSLADAPAEILFDVMNWPHYCGACGQWFALIDPNHPPGRRPKPALRAAKVRTPDNPHTHPQGMRWWPDDVEFSYDDINPEDRPVKFTEVS